MKSAQARQKFEYQYLSVFQKKLIWTLLSRNGKRRAEPIRNLCGEDWCSLSSTKITISVNQVAKRGEKGCDQTKTLITKSNCLLPTFEIMQYISSSYWQKDVFLMYILLSKSHRLSFLQQSSWEDQETRFHQHDAK